MRYMSYPTMLSSGEADVRDERRRSIDKHGANAQDLLPPGDPHLLYNLGEEFGEVCKALTYDQQASELRKELVQTAAMALAWIAVLDGEPFDG
jgi:hypothetical protein